MSVVPSCLPHSNPSVSSETVIYSDAIVNHPSALSSNTVDFLALGIQAVTSRSFGGNPSDKLPALNAILHQAMISYVPTVQHIPCSVRPLLA